MPAALAEARVSLPEFAAFQALWRRLRPLALALDFTANTRGGVGREDLRRIALRVLRTSLPALEVDILFYLFGSQGSQGAQGSPDGAHLNTHYMYQVRRGRVGGWWRVAGGGWMEWSGRVAAVKDGVYVCWGDPAYSRCSRPGHHFITL